MTDILANDEQDLQVEQTEPTPEEEAVPSAKYEIFSYPADTTLKGYLDQWNNNQLFIPQFQRDFVWDQTRASKLIESFLLGLPVPPTFLYKPAQSKSFWIIDGQQRIRSLVDFQKGVFGESKFRLKGVDPRWDGKTFEDLSESDQFSLQTTVLRAIVIQQMQPSDHTSIYHIFERLNTGGIRLNAMEVRQCVYVSSFLGKLKLWNEQEAWRDLIGLKKPDKRLKDRELLLRIVALYREQNYEKPMKRFLNECAVTYKLAEQASSTQSAADLDAIESTILDSISYVRRELGEKPFHLRGRLNFSAMDAVLVTLMKTGPVQDLPFKYKSLIADAQFQEDVSFNTSDESVVKRRLATAAKFLV
ncbi:DUF262 domain-containing protein [Rhizobium ruizarguesonis]|uniref:DUF262 domain-containing protein n=1 Tax=Rhizobium ruizarguesonis TaxID=2081791 RepID=UPI001030B328|nr:DUF262 domain-containing protein [Rhizobium ruizarguesonis]TBE09011.1 DUF262 domain-containing protein [Rhizobium ruizarguesonis]TBE80168.1 DUF262 domain-containing protein [Rhizobium ruizarguesonis]TBE89826.1 DUF262 domain-containing protein [Rhizobium ruizarguesonis]